MGIFKLIKLVFKDIAKGGGHFYDPVKKLNFIYNKRVLFYYNNKTSFYMTVLSLIFIQHNEEEVLPFWTMRHV